MKLFLTFIFIIVSMGTFAQRSKREKEHSPRLLKIDSIYVHLYTDSLKKGTYNYINIDGKLDNGHYYPLDTSYLDFKSSDGKFYGNSLWLDPDFKKEKVTISVTLKQNPALKKQFDIYIKKLPDPDLKPLDEILQDKPKKNKGVLPI